MGFKINLISSYKCYEIYKKKKLFKALINKLTYCQIERKNSKIITWNRRKAPKNTKLNLSAILLCCWWYQRNLNSETNCSSDWREVTPKKLKSVLKYALVCIGCFNIPYLMIRIKVLNILFAILSCSLVKVQLAYTE